MSKFGNVFLDDFAPRTGPWGVAYSFNCGAKARWFRFVIDLDLWDQISSKTYFSKHAKRGNGYYMETGRDTGSLRAVPNPYWASQENIVVNSACRWVIRGVDGDESVVAAHVPPIPRRS